MSRADDLTPLFRQAANTGALEFRQGIVMTWDSATGTNTVNVGGTTLSDLPCLNIGDFVVLSPGDVVGIQKVQNTYFILGRIQLPGPPDVNRAVVDTEIQDEVNVSFGVPTALAYGTKVTVNVAMPTWIRPGDEISIGATFTCEMKNTTAGVSRMKTRIVFTRVSDSFNLYQSTELGTDVGAGVYGQSTSVAGYNGDGWSTIAPGAVIAVKGDVTAGAVWATTADNVAQLMTTTIVRRTQ